MKQIAEIDEMIQVVVEDFQAAIEEFEAENEISEEEPEISHISKRSTILDELFGLMERATGSRNPRKVQESSADQSLKKSPRSKYQFCFDN